MEIKKLREIFKIFDESKATFFEYIDDDYSIKIQQKEYKDNQPTVSVTPAQQVIPQTQAAPAQAIPETNDTDINDNKDNLHTVKTPIVGTFYRSPSPDSAPFVEIGSKIKQGETLCIVEAMKLMNEIESDVTGTIQEILVENGDPVEYNQPLFLVKPE